MQPTPDGQRRPQVPLLSQIRHDLAEGIAHFPAGLLGRRPLWTNWYSSLEYKTLALDAALLANTDIPDDVLLRAHATLTREIAQTQLMGEDLQAVACDIVTRYIAANHGSLD